MASTAIVKTSGSKTGVPIVAEVAGDVVNGNNIPSLTNNTVILVHNAHATLAKTITFITSQTVDGLAVADRTVSIPALSTRVFTQMDPRLFGKTMEFTVETVDVKVQVFQP
jgi:hypothetical protein